MKRYVVKRYSNGKWTLLTISLYAENEDDAWDKARKLYHSPITVVKEYRYWMDED